MHILNNFAENLKRCQRVLFLQSLAAHTRCGQHESGLYRNEKWMMSTAVPFTPTMLVERINLLNNYEIIYQILFWF